MVLSRSIETCPSVSERMSRIVASVTKPSVTSTLPSGVLKRFCSVSAMFSWSWLMIPLVRSVWPSGIWESGVAWTVAMALARELGEAARGGGGVELRAFVRAKLEGAPVVIRGGTPLSQVVQAHGEVVGDVGVLGLQALGLEERCLRLGPAALRGVEVAERELQRRAVRVLGDVRAQRVLERFGRRVVGERRESRERGGVAGIELQHAAIRGRGARHVAQACLDRGEAELGVHVGRIGLDRGRVVAPGGGEVAL